VTQTGGQYGADFARAYDALMRGDYSYPRYADYIERVFETYGRPRDSLIADLGCGAGSLCAEMAGRGYDVIGIDNSPQMLAVARQKAVESGFADILFLEQDIDNFELYGTVGAFISTIDCVNYITDKRRLRRMFKLAGNYLPPGGLFIFDVNTAHKLSKIIGDGVFYEITDDFCYIWTNAYNGASKTSVFDLTFFTREADGRWRRHDELHRQRAYSAEDFAAAARGSGLEIQGVYSFLGFEKPLPNADKIVYVMVKPQ